LAPHIKFLRDEFLARNEFPNFELKYSEESRQNFVKRSVKSDGAFVCGLNVLLLRSLDLR
jgi:hypothetical protein